MKKKYTIENKYKDEVLLIFVVLLFVGAILGVIFGADIGDGAYPTK